jgi:hypothetical protein
MAKTGPIYICDPAKNKNCPKTGCKFTHPAYGMCECTRHVEFAKTDGQGRPIEVKGENDDEGVKN